MEKAKADWMTSSAQCDLHSSELKADDHSQLTEKASKTARVKSFLTMCM